jgi:hypothetical protein
MTPWALFLGGHWTRFRPTKPGRYPLATCEGDPVDPVRSGVIGPAGQELGLAPSEPGWQGYWWSLPYPQMTRRAE